MLIQKVALRLNTNLLGVITAALILPTASQGQTLYWDTNGTATGFGNFGGTWNVTNAFWNSDATGGAGGTLTASPTVSNPLVISGSGTTGSIQLSTNSAAASLEAANATAVTLFINNNRSLSVAGAITDTGSASFDVRMINTNAANAATVLTASSLAANVLGMIDSTGASDQFWTTGYDMTISTQFSIGQRESHTTFRQTGGNIAVTSGDRGVILAPNVGSLPADKTSTYVLDAGTLRAQRIGVSTLDGNNTTTNRYITSGILQFNGGTLQNVATNSTMLLQNGLAFGAYTGSGTKDTQFDTSKPLTIQLAQTGTRTFQVEGAGGRIIVTPSARLVNKVGEAGTLEKTGLGSLILTGGAPSAVNSWTGSTTVTAGKVVTDYSLIAGQAASGEVDSLSDAYSPPSQLVLNGGDFELKGRSSATATSATGVTLAVGSTQANVGSTTGWVVGQAVSNANFPPGTYIRRIVSATTIELNAM
ncbi:MAG: hypothetical protein ACRDBP_06720, partial [Luteolibacter sp.]